MDKAYKIIATVRSVKGHCDFGHRVGEQVVFDGETVQGRVCLHALYSFLPKVFAMRYGARWNWTPASWMGEPWPPVQWPLCGAMSTPSPSPAR